MLLLSKSYEETNSDPMSDFKVSGTQWPIVESIDKPFITNKTLLRNGKIAS